VLFALPLTRAFGISATEIAEAEHFLPAARWDRLRIGDRAYLRDLRAGELCERFNRLYLVTGATIRDEVPTHRGEGKAFL
jgi:D-serine deaminase-like pyridoxal phosphate-dependent protein